MENEAENTRWVHMLIINFVATRIWVGQHWYLVRNVVFVVIVVTSAIDIDQVPVSEELKPWVRYIPTFQKLYQQFRPKRNLTELYPSKNVMEEFKYQPKGETSLTDLNLTFVNMQQGIHCELWENIEKDALIEIIEMFGNDNNLTANRIKQMKLATKADYHVDAVEMFEHGLHGSFRNIKYAMYRRKEQTNYDFMISMYAFSWNFDTLTEKDILTGNNLEKEIRQNQDIHSGIDLSLIPVQGYETAAKQVKDIYRISAKNTISFAEKEKMLGVFRDLTDNTLSRQCSKSTTGKPSNKN